MWSVRNRVDLRQHLPNSRGENNDRAPRFPRQRTYLGATIEFNAGRSAFDGLIRNVSRGGLRVSLADTAALPDTTHLRVQKSARDVPVRLVWCSQSACGFEFTGWAGDLV